MTTVAEEVQFESLKRASERLDVSVQTLYRMGQQGELRLYKVGRLYKVIPSEVNEAIRKRALAPAEVVEQEAPAPTRRRGPRQAPAVHVVDDHDKQLGEDVAKLAELAAALNQRVNG